MHSIPGIRLIASDYDGTLARRGKVDPAFATELKQAAQHGRMMAVVTGRPLGNLLHILAENNLLIEGFPHALICEERDIYIWDHSKYQSMQEHNQAAFSLEVALLPQARQLADQLREAWPTLAKQQLLPSDPGAVLFGQSAAAVEDERGYVEMKFESPEASRLARTWLMERVQAVPGLTVVRNNRLTSLRHAAFGKGAVLNMLRLHLGLEASEVMAVGDSGNDLTMLNGSYGFHAAAVGNADPEAKTAVAAHNGVLLNGSISEGIRELLGVILWRQPDTIKAS